MVCWTTLISGYCSNGLINEARKVFDRMPKRNEVSSSAIVSGYVRNGFFNETILMFQELKSCSNVSFNGLFLVSVLNACVAIGEFEDGKWIQSYVDMNGFYFKLEIGTAFVLSLRERRCFHAMA